MLNTHCYYYYYVCMLVCLCIWLEHTHTHIFSYLYLCMHMYEIHTFLLTMCRTILSLMDVCMWLVFGLPCGSHVDDGQFFLGQSFSYRLYLDFLVGPSWMNASLFLFCVWKFSPRDVSHMLVFGPPCISDLNEPFHLSLHMPILYEFLHMTHSWTSLWVRPRWMPISNVRWVMKVSLWIGFAKTWRPHIVFILYFRAQSFNVFNYADFFRETIRWWV